MIGKITCHICSFSVIGNEICFITNLSENLYCFGLFIVSMHPCIHAFIRSDILSVTMFKIKGILITNSFLITLTGISNAIALLLILVHTTTAYAIENNQPDINATNLYKTHNMVLGNNVKNLVILVPNEAHEPYSLKEQQLINQAFIPQNVRMNVGTTTVFFNADVGHDHREVIVNGLTGSRVFDTRIFSYDDNDDEDDKIPNNSRNYTFNEIGDFSYYDTVFGKKVMNGTIEVVSNPLTQATTMNNNDNDNSLTSYYPQYDFDTIGAFVVPTEMLNKYTRSFENQGLQIYDIHNFRNLMDKDDAEHSLIVWTSNGHTLESVIEKLQKITPTLPYA
jgi:plastocyanin